MKEPRWTSIFQYLLPFFHYVLNLSRLKLFSLGLNWKWGIWDCRSTRFASCILPVIVFVVVKDTVQKRLSKIHNGVASRKPETSSEANSKGSPIHGISQRSSLVAGNVVMIFPDSVHRARESPILTRKTTHCDSIFCVANSWLSDPNSWSCLIE